MKKLLSIILVLVSLSAFSQPVINRSLSVNTVSDARLQAQRNLFTPRYVDTTSANLDKGVDSCGAIIFTYSTNSLWLRACNPKRWVQGSGGGGTIVTENTESVILSGTGDASDPLTADVVLSTSAPNAIQLLPDGLYVPNVIRNGLVYGGTVTWVSGYTYNVSEAGYYINNVFYTSPATTVTLDSADATLDRIDVFVVDNTSAVAVLTGTPAANPEEPDVDIATQLRLSFALVQAATTEPTNDSTGLRRECIYQENTEWTASASTSRINPNSTNSPCVGLKSVEGTAVINGDNVLFTRPGGSITILDSFAVLTFQIKSKGNWGNNRRLQFRFELAGTPVGAIVTLGSASYGWSSNLLTCQTVSIPLTDFGFTTGAIINSLRITANMNNGSIGWYIDNICLQNQPQTVYATPLTLQNGLNLDESTNIGELGGTLLHNTTNYTNTFVHTFSGITVYNYPYQFQQLQGFQNSTSIASFFSQGGAGDYTFTNRVKLGVNFTGPLYDTSPLAYGYFGDRWGYMINTNLRGHGSFGMYQDDSTSKNTGIFFHTKDNLYRDGVSIFAADSTNTTGDFSANLGDFKVATFMTDKNIKAYGYPSTRNDGATAKALYMGSDSIIKYGPVSVTSSNVSVLNDSTILVCSAPNVCDTFVTSTITIQNVYVLNDSTLIVCESDGVTCDTVSIPQTSFDRGFFSPNQWADSIVHHNADGHDMYVEGLDTLLLGGKAYFLWKGGLPLSSAGTLQALAIDTVGGVNRIYRTNVLSAITADNGLTANTSTNIQLGGTLLQNTTIDATGSYFLTLTGSVSTQTLRVINTGASGSGIRSSVNAGLAIWGEAVGGGGVYGQTDTENGVYGAATSTGIGVRGNAESNYAVYGQSQSGTAFGAQTNNSSTNTVVPIINVIRGTTGGGGAGANGIGGSIDFTITNATNSGIANQIISKWTDATHVSRTSQFEIWGVNSAVTARKLAIAGNGELTLDTYGVGTHTGTAAYGLSVTAAGKVIETPVANYTFINGLTDSSSTGTVGLGGTIYKVTTVAINPSNVLNFTGSTDYASSKEGLLRVVTTTTSGQGIYVAAQSTSEAAIEAVGGTYGMRANGTFGINSFGSSIGIVASTTSGTGLSANSTSGIASFASSNTGTVFQGQMDHTNTNAIEQFNVFIRSTSGTAATGIGLSEDYYIENDNGNLNITNQLIFKLTNAASGSEVSQFEVWNKNAGSMSETFTIGGEAFMKLKGITSTAASAITAADGMIVYVTNTNGTFTSIGFWARENGAWVKL